MMNTEIIIPSFAKINLTLRVIGKRFDGYHEIFSIFQTVSLFDELVIRESGEIEVECDNEEIPKGRENIVFSALAALSDETGVKKGASILIRKRIPSPGGLGGGSSNAAVALMAVSKLWGIGLSLKELAVIGARVGSDVPLFFYGGTMAGTGRGTVIEPMPDVEFRHVLIASPKTAIATSDAYRDLALGDLTKNGSKSILKHYRERAERLYTGRFEFHNDFETVVFEQYPDIENTAAVMASSGARNVMLSGSGPSVVGIFEKAAALKTASSRLLDRHGVRCFPVSTISRKSYFERLGLGSGQSFDV